MSATVISRAGQTLDDIVFENYGFARHMLEAVKAANPAALRLGIHLPAGLSINLPEITTAQSEAVTVNLWD